jgi:hypothetical protein
MLNATKVICILKRAMPESPPFSMTKESLRNVRKANEKTIKFLFYAKREIK